MSDLLKKIKRKEEAPLGASPQQEILPQPAPPSQAPAPKPPQHPPPAPQAPEPAKGASERKSPYSKGREEQEKAHKVQEVRISPVIMKETKASYDNEAEKLYDETLLIVEHILEKHLDYTSIDIGSVTGQIEKMINQLILRDEHLLTLSLIKDVLNSHYLNGHIVNVTILSIKIGLILGYEKSKLIALGISALFHDIGMANYLSIANQPRKITAEEYNEIKKHTTDGLKACERIKGFNREASYAAEQHHERLDGSGYPRGIKKEAINEYAKIVSLVDVYEAMTHPRVYRSTRPCLETMQEVLKLKNTFERKILKILIEHIGILPLGSFVELNTKEVAQVVKLNPRYPMRPVVKIVYDNEGKTLEKEKMLNLSTQYNIYATKCVSIKKGIDSSRVCI